MNMTLLTEKFGGNGISFEEYHGFPAVRMENKFSRSLISLYGAHVIEFELPDTEPVLWMSDKSVFADGSPIRGGVPVCFPWFGPAPEGENGSHGFVRNAMWEITAAGLAPEGGNFVELNFKNENFELFYTVSAGRQLVLSLVIENISGRDFYFGGALHTYFNVSNSMAISVEDLDGLSYFDSLTGQWQNQSGALHIDREIDRIFNTPGSTRIIDPEYKRVIHVDKYGSDSTVVWNPWIDKSKRMPDFGDDEYQNMICIESAKVPKIGDTGIIHPDAEYELRQIIRVEKIN